MRGLSGRGWAYVGAGLGGAVSIAANVAHSYVPPEGAAADWTPPPGAVVGAVFWPVSLFVAIEILARVPWPEGKRWTALRFGGLLPVALVAAFVSYKHLSGLLTFYGEDTLTATLGPLAVDGLMVMATGALLATTPRGVPVVQPEPVREATPVQDTVPPPVVQVSGPVYDHATPIGPKPPRKQVDKVSTPPTVQVSRTTLSSKDRVVQAHERTPDATNEALAALLGVSTKTVQRYRPPKKVNGHVPELEGASK